MLWFAFSFAPLLAANIICLAPYLYRKNLL